MSIKMFMFSDPKRTIFGAFPGTTREEAEASAKTVESLRDLDYVCAFELSGEVDEIYQWVSVPADVPGGLKENVMLEGHVAVSYAFRFFVFGWNEAILYKNGNTEDVLTVDGLREIINSGPNPIVTAVSSIFRATGILPTEMNMLETPQAVAFLMAALQTGFAACLHN